MILIKACSVVLFVAASVCHAASFDLTSSVEAFDVRESVIDLGQVFSRIDSAYVRFEGNYTPGLLLATNWIPPRTYRADNFQFIIRLGEPGTSWIDKRVYATPSLQGLDGEVAFEMPLRESAGPSFWPGGGSIPNYDFLLDGRFGLSVTSLLISLGEELIDPPRFTLTKLSLYIDGIAIPEPSCILMSIAGALCICSRRSMRRVSAA